MNATCPVCGGDKVSPILEIADLPVFCNVQLDTREEALTQPKGDMCLEYCGSCSHVFNSAFDEGLLAYSEAYENSLHYSSTFSRFAEELARRLVNDYSLRGKRIVDVGCGKGDFLSLICELGGNHGYGFDKSYEEGRAAVPAEGSVEYFKDFFSSAYSHIEPDLVSCRHVLEHIPQPRAFLDEILSGLDHDAGFRVYFEVPNALYTVRDMGIWDLIYEHCQYFSPRSLSRIFADAGVSIDNVYECFGGQFLSLEGRVRMEGDTAAKPGARNGADDDMRELVDRFSANFQAILDKWEGKIAGMDGSAVVWGAGSKGATFLNLMQDSARIDGIVDINPNKQGKFVPCSGHEIFAPDALIELKPKHVFVMNPMYEHEIGSAIEELGVSAELHLVE